MAFLCPPHPLIKVLLLNLGHIVSSLFLECLLVIRKFNSLELASQWIELNFGLELFLLNKARLLQNSIKRLLPRVLVQPLVLRHVIIVHLLVNDILSDIIRAIPLHKLVRMKDSFRTFLRHLLQLLLVERWEQSLIALVYDHGRVRPGHDFATVQTRALALLRTDHLATPETVVYQFVLLGHAIALYSVEVYLSWLVAFCFFHLFYPYYYQSINSANFIIQCNISPKS